MQNSTRFSALALVAAILFGVGCASTDRHVFNSTMSRPVTVSLIDTGNEQTVWSKAVPGGQKLIMDLDSTSSSDNPFMAPGVPANKVTWKTFPMDSRAIVKGHQVGRALDSGVAKLPGTPVIIDVTYAKPVPPVQTEPVVTEQPAPPAEAPAEAEEPEAAATDEPMAEEAPAEAPAAEEAPAAPPAAEEAPAEETPAAQPEAEEAPAQDEPMMFK